MLNEHAFLTMIGLSPPCNLDEKASSDLIRVVYPRIVRIPRSRNPPAVRGDFVTQIAATMTLLKSP